MSYKTFFAAAASLVVVAAFPPQADAKRDRRPARAEKGTMSRVLTSHPLPPTRPAEFGARPSCSKPFYRRMSDDATKCLFSGKPGEEDLNQVGGRGRRIMSYFLNDGQTADIEAYTIDNVPVLSSAAERKGCAQPLYQKEDAMFFLCEYSGPDGAKDGRQISGMRCDVSAYYKDGKVAESSCVRRAPEPN